MDALVITGNGPLRGETHASGAKNAALPILAASLLAEGEHTFRNVPELADVATMLKLLETMGCAAERQSGKKRDVCLIDVPRHVTPEAPYELVKTMRASVLVLGPLVARYGRAKVSLPGGCAIGARPIDQHLKGLEALGATIHLAEGYVQATAKRLHGARVTFDVVTVTGTENLMMAAALARGTSILENAAREPEVEELARVLNRMGAKISGAGSSVITVEGVDTLAPVDHAIIADRIEAGTLLAAGAITAGDVVVKNAVPEHLGAVMKTLRAMGAKLSVERDGIRVVGPRRAHPVDIVTQEHPGFPTDMQAQMMAVLATASGTSVITENIFENRFMHVAELLRMGADISAEGSRAVVRGVPQLSGAPVMATDLRASASLVLAALSAKGKTTVSRVYHLDRGYERLEKKLRGLGANIRRVKA